MNSSRCNVQMYSGGVGEAVQGSGMFACLSAKKLGTFYDKKNILIKMGDQWAICIFIVDGIVFNSVSVSVPLCEGTLSFLFRWGFFFTKLNSLRNGAEVENVTNNELRATDNRKMLN